MTNQIQPSHAQEEQPQFIGRCIHCNVQLFRIDGKVVSASRRVSCCGHEIANAQERREVEEYLREVRGAGEMATCDDNFAVYIFQAASYFENLRTSGEWSDFFFFALDEYAREVCHGSNALKFSLRDVASAWIWFQQPKRFCRLAAEWEARG